MKRKNWISPQSFIKELKSPELELLMKRKKREDRPAMLSSFFSFCCCCWRNDSSAGSSPMRTSRPWSDATAGRIRFDRRHLSTRNKSTNDDLENVTKRTLLFLQKQNVNMTGRINKINGGICFLLMENGDIHGAVLTKYFFQISLLLSKQKTVQLTWHRHKHTDTEIQNVSRASMTTVRSPRKIDQHTALTADEEPSTQFE